MGSRCGPWIQLGVLASLVAGQGFAQPAEPGHQAFVPLILADAERTTGIAVSNFGTEPATVTFRAYGTDGNLIWPVRTWGEGSPPGPLPPGGQRALLIWELFGLDSHQAWAGWLHISFSSPAVRVVYQLVSHAADLLDGANAMHSPQRRLIFPWVLEGPGRYRGADAQSSISLVNPGDDAFAAEITWVSGSGADSRTAQALLGPREAVLGRVSDWFPGLTGQGALVVTVPQIEPSARLVGCQLLTVSQGGRRALVVLNGLEPATGRRPLYSAQAAFGPGIATDVSLVNPTPEPIAITMHIREDAGQVAAGPVSLDVEPGSVRQVGMEELFHLTTGLVGTLGVETDRPGLVGSVLFGDPAQGYAAALPLAPELHSQVVFPHAAHLRGGAGLPGFFTGIALHAPATNAPTAGTLRVLLPDGSQSGSGDFELAPGGRVSRLLSELTDLPEQAGGYLQITPSAGGGLVAQQLFGESSLRMMSAVPAFLDPAALPAELPWSEFIVTDQFGYLPESEKIAVIRDPVSGFDADKSFEPGATYAVVEAETARRVFIDSTVRWNDGAEDPSSGDRAWWFDFTQVTDEGDYYVVDLDRQVRSPRFSISRSVYGELLKQAVRTFFYQRAGHPKPAQDAGRAWADGASHLGPFQDPQCRLYNRRNDPATERDLRGGWYDAGDYNKYTSWTAGYVVELLRAWRERPGVFGDDFGLPESGNGIPDLLDEAGWGMDWLKRMQNPDGSVLSIVGMAHASPPSAATGQCLYGSASTSATRAAAAAFAWGSIVYQAAGGALAAEADDLLERAKRAWSWAEANPQVLFRNNDGAAGTGGLGAGQQETDDYGRLVRRLAAACFLFEATGEPSYKTVFDNSYRQLHLMQWTFAYPFEVEAQEVLLHYASLPAASPAVAQDIRRAYLQSIQSGSDNLPAHRRKADPYLAHLKDYTWGSNSIKARQGMMFQAIVRNSLAPELDLEARRAAERYLHYLHGVNPLGIVYLSNMYGFGAERSVNEFYHSWFTNGSALWDRVGASRYGPPPGFLVGGPNPFYDWDGCCPSNCGSSANNALCHAEPISPPKGQPKQKSYRDFNTSWPLNSWSVTENSNGYQVWYIRLLSHFVPPEPGTSASTLSDAADATRRHLHLRPAGVK